MKKYVALLAICAFFSCKDAKKEKKEDAMTEKEMVKPEVKLYTFSGGEVIANKLELFSQDTTYQGQSREFADAIYVISHPKGNLMWDAGLPEALVGQPGPTTPPGGAFTISRKDSVVNQLKQIGLTPQDFKYIALSHSHFDHTGSANVFKDATWLVQGVEYDSIKNNEGIFGAVSELKNIQRLNGDHDVFGDGSVVLKSTPGHTPGHMVLYVDLVEHGPVLLSGDLYHLIENREHQRVPSFNFDVDQTIASMESFEAFAKETGAKVYIQHRKEDFEKMPKAPNYLK